MVVKLGKYIEKVHIKATDIEDFQDLQVYGVSNKEGITITSHKASEDVSKYLYIDGNCFAYNPYRINVGSIGLTPEGISGLVSPAYVVFKTKKGKLLPKLLLDFLKSPDGLHEIAKYARGTVRKALRYKELCEIEIPEISYEKQLNSEIRRSKIKQGLSPLIEEIANQSSYLSQLRQAILQEAIEGKLTANWRKENPVRKGDPDYDAEALLDKIKAEKEKLVKEGKIKKQKALAPIKPEEVPFELPEGWVWTKLGEISDSILGKMLDKAKNKGEHYNYLRNLNVRWFDFDLGDLKKIRLQEHEVEKYLAYKYDLLICEGGYPGRSAIWEQDEPIVFQKAIHRVRSFFSDHNEWLLYNLKLLDMNRKIEKYFTGAGIKHLTGVKLKTIEIPLPPLSEMKIILERIKSYYYKVDELEKQVSERKEQSEQLMQAVLREAFEGANHA